MNEFWKIAVGTAGLGALASFVIWSLYKQWLKLPIFQRMTKRQQFVSFILFLSLTFLFAIAGLVTYAVVQLNQPSHSAEDSRHELIAVLKQRREKVTSLIDDRRDEILRHQNARRAGFYVRPESTVAEVDAFKTKFLALVDRKLNALDSGDLLLAQELTMQIHRLLHEDWVRKVFTDVHIVDFSTLWPNGPPYSETPRTDLSYVSAYFESLPETSRSPLSEENLKLFECPAASPEHTIGDDDTN